jgi:hypothetical protein
MPVNKGSEKLIEKYLKEMVESVCGGMCIKLTSASFTGLPDRMLIFPGGKIIFVELKSTGKKQSARQIFVNNQFCKRGVRVDVIDTLEAAAKIINEHARL